MRKKLEYIRLTLTIAFIAVVIGISGAQSLNLLKTGDLIFQVEGKSDFSQAIANSTSNDSDSMKFVHVGIIEVENDSIKVIEASSEEGVRIIGLDEFLKNSPQLNGEPTVVIKRLNMEFPVEEAIERAKIHLGEPYDWWYLPDNGKMYCSELVYESYLDSNGKPIFQSQPMNFRNPDGSMPQFWIDLFQELGQPIPEGLPGTNPNDLSKHPLLQTITSL